jgi:hypothetical protein
MFYVLFFLQRNGLWQGFHEPLPRDLDAMIRRISLCTFLILASSGLTIWNGIDAQTVSGLTLREFSRLMASLSEPEGYFDSDNFVSNEAGYLKVLPVLRQLGVHGGVYLGVGPDQNYSYIAEVKPELAFLIDIRRQNALQHLYYKALFQLSEDRAGYLERLFGRKLKSQPESRRRGETIAELLRLVDDAPEDRDFAQKSISEACSAIRSWNAALDEADFETIRYIAQAFMEGGPDIKFSSYHRAPRPHHPTYRQLLEETDAAGVRCSFLAQERRFQYVKLLQQENRIIPVVGDLGGTTAVRRTAEELRRLGLHVECFYLSNVEFYLFGGNRWRVFVENMRILPWAPNGILIRSYANMWHPHPDHIPGYYMTSLVQPVRSFLRNEEGGKDDTYWDLVTRDNVAH